MRSLRPIRRGSSVHGVRGRSLGPAALPALLRATHLLGLALGSALGRLRESGVTAARMFEKAEEHALLLSVTREAASSVPRAVRARRSNHIWMVDLTDVKGLFGLVTFKVGVVFDAFSRMPLSARVFGKEPSSAEIARFVASPTAASGSR